MTTVTVIREPATAARRPTIVVRHAAALPVTPAPQVAVDTCPGCGRDIPPETGYCPECTFYIPPAWAGAANY